MAVDPSDGLVVASVGSWSEDKYLHVEHFARMFARAMKGKWDCRAYLELCSGPGRAVVDGSGAILDTASLRVLELEPGFDVLVFGELDNERLAALQARCGVRKPEASCRFVQGDMNESWTALRDRIRETAGPGRYLTFCFVDPYRCADLSFSTIEGLAELYVDFLVLIPSFMDANRNREIYLKPDNGVLDNFLGDPNWRSAWAERKEPGERFGIFVADRFGKRMKALGYKYEGLDDMKLIRSTDKNLPLYHLAFFSRHDLGMKLWREAMRSSDPQRQLF